MRWGSALISLAFTAGCGDLAQAEALPTAPDAAVSTSSGGGDDSTTTPDAELDFESTGVSTGGSTSDESTGPPPPPTQPADVIGIHDGMYSGTVSIDFISAGACTGSITIIVDSSVDPPIVGEGQCQGEIFGLPEGGDTVVDGELAFEGPMGTATQILDGEEVEVTWDGAFNSTNFTGTFEGHVELFGNPVDFEGVWNVDR